MSTPRWKTRGMTVQPVTGAALVAALPDVAALRMAVFRDFPYLYDGDLAYERDYLEAFIKASGAVVVLAKDGGRIVGASTGMPMSEAGDEWSAPFIAAGRGIEALFYCGESVLLPEYRGLGIGHSFFIHREGQAKGLGLSESCFCSVVRPDDHPARPREYRANDAFWRKRGYAPLEGVVAAFAWKDVGRDRETTKPLQFWWRDLTALNRQEPVTRP